MASPYQQQVFQRKLMYIGIIVVLFTVSWGWRNYVVAKQANELSIREESRGEVELTGAVFRLALTGSRGIVTTVLWYSALDMQKKNELSELEVVVRSLAKLQPHFITPWLFQSWNLSYNVYAEVDRPADKFFYMTRGVELLAEGERQNRDHPDLRWALGFYVQHKVHQSDETNVQRSLFQLTYIPPNERDPARFWKQGDKGPELNMTEFKAFCEKYPQLIRRLREGIHRERIQEKRRQFTCEKPADVVQFLEDNQQVPSLYRSDPPPANVPASSRTWDRNKKDEFLPVEQRFPALPPERDHKFDPASLTTASTLRDDTDANAAAQAWYAYAQEPLPEPGDLPGSSKPIENRARQRRPRNMTTLIFRNYPAQGRRYMAERLQQEGWYDDEGYDVSDWFEGPTVIGGGRVKWSLEAWIAARNAWTRHGEANKLLFKSPAEKKNMEDLAERFAKKFRVSATGAPPDLREDTMTAEERREYRAAQYMFEWNFYNSVSNFMHHYHRALVEAREETVMTRKLFFQAERLNFQAASPKRVCDEYEKKRELPAWKGKKLNVLEAWRELVLRPNKDYRRDDLVQEQTAEFALRYQYVANALRGRKEKSDVRASATLLPLVPPTQPDLFRAPIVEGPFAGTDDEGVPWVDDRRLETVAERMGLTIRKSAVPSPPPSGMQPPRTRTPSR
jgi:hypothetical protein